MASAKKECSMFYTCFFLQNLVIFQTLVAAKPQFPCFFIFGDSLVDNGNNNDEFHVNYLPYGIDFPIGPTGRFNDGRNMADILATRLGFEHFIPPFANGKTEDILAGLNYASGGAGILNETGSHPGYPLTSLNEQLSNHELTISRLEKLLVGESAAKQHLQSCLYYVGIGSNDYILNYLPQFYSSFTNYTPKQFATLLISQYSTSLRRLYKYGARKVVVVELGQLGCMPFAMDTYGSPNSSYCVETTNEIVRIFNQRLRILVYSLNHGYPKAKFVQGRDVSLTASSGNIKIVSKACCVVQEGPMGLCVEGSVPCSKRDEYRFWDDVHPTEAAVVVAADTIYNDMSPLFLDPWWIQNFFFLGGRYGCRVMEW